MKQRKDAARLPANELEGATARRVQPRLRAPSWVGRPSSAMRWRRGHYRSIIFFRSGQPLRCDIVLGPQPAHPLPRAWDGRIFSRVPFVWLLGVLSGNIAPSCYTARSATVSSNLRLQGHFALMHVESKGGHFSYRPKQHTSLAKSNSAEPSSRSLVSLLSSQRDLGTSHAQPGCRSLRPRTAYQRMRPRVHVFPFQTLAKAAHARLVAGSRFCRFQ